MPYIVIRKEDGKFFRKKRAYYYASEFTEDINKARVFKSIQGALNSNADLKPRNPKYTEWREQMDAMSPEDRLRIRQLAPEARCKYKAPPFYLNVCKDEYEIVEIKMEVTLSGK